MPDVKTESLPHNAGFLISEANGFRSRDQVTIARQPAVVKAGTVMAIGEDGNYRTLDLTDTEGNTTSDGILLNDVDAREATKPGVLIIRDAEVRDDDLIWPAGITDNQKNTEIARLLLLGIVVRTVATTVSTQTS